MEQVQDLAQAAKRISRDAPSAATAPPELLPPALLVTWAAKGAVMEHVPVRETFKQLQAQAARKEKEEEREREKAAEAAAADKSAKRGKLFIAKSRSSEGRPSSKGSGKGSGQMETSQSVPLLR